MCPGNVFEIRSILHKVEKCK
uniref:Uncharacterized protein n=1 Tax=Anguilla anguilla TaxID=7936 RepID=A0A0E9S7G7_ANGAN